MELEKIWKEVESYHELGLSIIPVRDKQEGERPAKTPYGSWKKYQLSPMTKGELFAAMEHYNTSAVAVVTGVVSGNLEIIDVDSKYKLGFDATLFSAIKELYPELWSRLRIHKTPSGGYHIIYKIADHAPAGNAKLASRAATEEDIAAAQARGVKKPSNAICFLETRGEGGFALLPPSMGYSLHNNVPIPTITWEERCSLMTLCQTFNEVVRIEPTPRPAKAQDDFYAKNPFDDYNARVDPNVLMQESGWKYLSENSHFIWYTRPDKTQGVSASYNKERGVFYIFTSSTELEGARGYNPSSLLAEFSFNGDKKRTYTWLVNNGYGEVKRSVEQRIIKQAVISGSAIPANFSEQAQEQFTMEVQANKEAHPYGIFWLLDDEGGIKISREDLYHVAHEMGMRLHNNAVVQVTGRFIVMLSNDEFFDIMKSYVREEEADLYRDICNCYESFIQASGKFTIARLRALETENIICDTVSECYKFYNDIAVRITAHDVQRVAYDDIDGLIWEHKVLDRDFPQEGATRGDLYRVYLKNATGFENNVRNIIGYLCHDFKSRAAGYIILMTERVLNPKDGGGSGKNIFGDILKNMISMKSIPASMIKFDDTFFSAWNSERVLFLPDLPKNIDWTFLKNISTDDIFVNKKHVQQYTVAAEDGPKILLNTNYSYNDIDGGIKRRVRPIEFTDYYTVNGGVDAVHGKMFPMEFEKEDWTDFDLTVVECIQYNIRQGGKIEMTELSETGWEKKFKNNFAESTYDFIVQNMEDWLFSGFITNTNFTTRYNEYCREIDLNPKYKASSTLMNSALEEYCKRHNIEFNKAARNSVARGRSFGSMGVEEDAPF